MLKKRKPISRAMYEDLLEKMINITNKYKDEIDVSPNNLNAKYKDIMNRYIQDLEYKIIKMKNGYLYTLIKKHYFNDDKMKRNIIIESNIPRKRNEVKKCFNEIIYFIQNNFKEKKDIKKCYYILIINILNKYENITDKDILMAKKLYKDNKLETLNSIEVNNNENNEKENLWIRQKKTKKAKIFKIFAIILPLTYALSYFYSFINSN